MKTLFTKTLAMLLLGTASFAADNNLVQQALRESETAQRNLKMVVAQLTQQGQIAAANQVSSANNRLRESSRLMRASLSTPDPICPNPNPYPPTPNPYPPTPNPYPPTPPNPYPPYPPVGQACEMSGAGVYNGYQWSYRGGYNGKILFGTNTFENMITQLNGLEAAGLCVKSGTSCSLGGSGVFNGYQWTYRLNSGTSVVSNAIFGTNTFETLLSTYDRLASERLCYPRAAACDLEGSGVFNGYQWSSRLSVGGQVVFGSNTQATVLTALQQLRSRGFCQ